MLVDSENLEIYGTVDKQIKPLGRNGVKWQVTGWSEQQWEEVRELLNDHQIDFVTVFPRRQIKRDVKRDLC